MKYVVFYEVADGVEAGLLEHFPAHRARSLEFRSSGTLLLTGPFADRATAAPTAPASMAIFTTREAAEEFVRGDPFVLEGLVGTWSIREWHEGFGL